jgi:hypothetical protein
MPYAPATPQAAAAVAQVIEALDALPTPDRLLALRSLAVLLGSRRAAAVLEARAEGLSWQDIADRLGMSRQSVWTRYSAEDLDPPAPARGRRPARRAALHAASSCAAYKAVTTRLR